MLTRLILAYEVGSLPQHYRELRGHVVLHQGDQKINTGAVGHQY